MLVPNTVLQNRYRVIEPIGQGGMGAVYRAIDTRLQCSIALKETLLTEAVMRRAFEHEARLLARLRHPAMPKVSDHFTEGAGQFLVMDYIPGHDLEQLLPRLGGKFPFMPMIRWIVHWTDQLLDALEYLHTQSSPIVHRDIKPKNLKISPQRQIILLDFGLAKGGLSYVSTVTSTDNQSTALEGSNPSITGYTPHYAPLEQHRGGTPDARSDLYSLAATLYHLITGVRPPDALSRVAAMLNSQRDPLRPIIELSPQVPVPVAELLHQALSLSADARPASAAEMRRLWWEALKGVPIPPPPMPGASASSSGATAFTAPAAQPAPTPPPTPKAPPPAAVPLGTLLHTLSIHSLCWSVAFSPDGRLLVAEGEDNTLGLWRVNDGSLAGTLAGHGGSIRSVAWSPDGRLIVSGGEDKTVRLWRVTDGTLAYVLDIGTHAVESAIFSPDGQLLAAGGWGSSVARWRMGPGTPQPQEPLPSNFVQALAFSPDGQLLAAGCYDGSVSIWRTSDGQQVRVLSGHLNSVLSVAFSPDGQVLATGGGDSSIRLWRARTGRPLDVLQGHTNVIRSVAFSPDSQLLASGSEDRSVRLWHVSDSSLAYRLNDHPRGVTSVTFSPDGQILATSSHDTRLRLWKM